MGKMYMFSCLVLVLCVSRFMENMECALVMENLQVVFRHGRRSPNTYAWHDESEDYFNTHGAGQLTPPGRRDLYRLGKFLRDLYHDFIGDNPHMVSFLSTPSDRTLESAQALSAGLLPPRGPFEWLADLDWQPKAIFTMKVDLRNNTALKLFASVLEDDATPETKSELKVLLDELNEVTGRNLTSFYDIFWYYDQAECERAHGFDLPQWLIPYMDRITAVTGKIVRKFCSHLSEFRPYTDEIFEDIISYFTQNTTLRGRFYAMHDAHLSAILCKLGYEVKAQVPFGAAIIFQLHSEDDQKYVRVFYNDSPTHDVMKPLNVTGCPTLCPLEDFVVRFNED